jgi:hypothetical protein
MPEDSYAQILSDAKRDRDAAAKRLLGFRNGKLVPTDMTQAEAERLEEAKIRELTSVIEKLGFRDNRSR